MYLIDTGVLGKIVSISESDIPFIERFAIFLSNNHPVKVPEIADYELRRKLIQLDTREPNSKKNRIAKLNKFIQEIGYLPLTTPPISGKQQNFGPRLVWRVFHRLQMIL